MKFSTLFTLMTISISSFCFGQKKIALDVNLDVKHLVGMHYEMERNKFVNIHADITEGDWGNVGGSINQANANYRNDFLNGYDVYMGRNTGLVSGQLSWGNITEDPTRLGYADPAAILVGGMSNKSNYKNASTWHGYETRNDQIICLQQFPFYPDGVKTNKGWAFSQEEITEPFGTATGEYYGRFLSAYFGTGGTTGQPIPKWVEIINEPLWPLYDWVATPHTKQPLEKVWKFHATVAKQIKIYNPDVKVGGYVAAFPNFETNDANSQTPTPDFDRWEKRDKAFLDIAGADMDFISIHLYDFPCWSGRQLYRKGSNVEATLDMLEQYSFLKFGVVKPFVISEFGAAMHQTTQTWTPYRDWLDMKSTNSMMMQFMQRPNTIDKALHFLMLKWSWEGSDTKTYMHRLFRKANEPSSYTGDWVYTDHIKLYSLWKDVKGTRVDTKANNLDVLTDCYINGNIAYVAVNSLNLSETFVIQPKLFGTTNTISSLKVKRLFLDKNILTNNYATPILSEQTYSSNEIPTEFNLSPEEMMILEYSYDSNIDISQTKKEYKYYATTYKQPILANQETTFTFNNVNIGEPNGEVVLRLGVGRAFGLSIIPTVTVNGTEVALKTKNYRGDDQYLGGNGRFTFFGVLEIDVPFSLLKTGDNIASVKFTDNGGYLSTAILQVSEMSKVLPRFEGANTNVSSIKASDIQISYNNKRHQLTVTGNDLANTNTLVIYNIMGQQMVANQVFKTNKTIDLVYLNAGMYIVSVTSDNRQYSCKIMVTN